jgi:hypothetical protein
MRAEVIRRPFNGRLAEGPVSRAFLSGRCRARTSDLLLVRQALSQLS